MLDRIDGRDPYYIGVQVCEPWRKFEAFFADMGPRPRGTSLDRIDNEKGYEPGNCRWATKAVQSENRRASIMVEIDGRKACLRRWADERRLNYSTVRSRVRRGWDPVAALGGPHGAGEAK